jgi:hypothetical protein
MHDIAAYGALVLRNRKPNGWIYGMIDILYDRGSKLRTVCIFFPPPIKAVGPAVAIQSDFDG